MWTVPNILLTIFGLVLMVTPLALWVAWTITIFIGVLVAALISRWVWRDSYLRT